MHFDVFNGDADGIMSLVQLRLAEPQESILITGVKRDIALLEQVNPESASSVTVLDISMEKNSEALTTILHAQVPVRYFDHHRIGQEIHSPLLSSHINTSADVCTGLLVNDYLHAKHYLWAIASAFGDNLDAVAMRHCALHGIEQSLAEQLKSLGTLVNYNGYGRYIEDLHFHPADLFKQLLACETPVNLFNQGYSVYHQLQDAYQQDMARAQSAQVLYNSSVCKVVSLDDQPWARRVSGVFSNQLANNAPDKAHAVLTKNVDDSYTVSVRAPLNDKQGADEVCVQFTTGGGRAGAAGINALPQEQVERFISTLENYYN
ncbi:DHHA1 domain-containing protein [Thalassotalea aquiviva]|uniref:DHHA1 domain-containing protein n=1 Tax=Thalassotalea aquiviva TaxID=3242415 RepID=UPI00352A93A6